MRILQSRVMIDWLDLMGNSLTSVVGPLSFSLFFSPSVLLVLTENTDYHFKYLLLPSPSR